MMAQTLTAHDCTQPHELRGTLRPVALKTAGRLPIL
jgi:hypothetical protein